MTRSQDHVDRAVELLELLKRQEHELRELDPDEHLQMVADGSLKRLNDSRDWTLELVKAEALVAIALRLGYLGHLQTIAGE